MISEETLAVLIKVAGFKLVLTLLFLVMFFRHPDVLVRILQRWLIFKSGFSVKSVKVDDFTFEYMEKGSPDSSSCSLLLIHGFSSSKDSYCNFGKYLPKRIHIVALDLPGHGGTTRNVDTDYTLESFIKRMKQFCDATKMSKRKFHLLGGSLGASISGLYAKDYGNDLLSLTLMCPPGLREDEMEHMEKKYRETGKLTLLPQTAEETQEMFDRILYNKVKIPSYIMRGVLKIRLKGNEFFHKLVRHLDENTSRHFLRDSLEDIRTPTLVLWGAEDEIINVSTSNIFREKMPSCQIKIIEKCGHTIVLERPRKAAAIVTEFINSLDKKME